MTTGGITGLEVFASPTTTPGDYVNITDAVLESPPVSITVGLQDWATDAKTNKCTLTLLNEDNSLTPGEGILSIGHYLIVRVQTDQIRFYGKITELQNTWDETGTVKKVAITATGPTQPLLQTPAVSELRNNLYNPGSPEFPHSYWPLESDSDIPSGHALTSDPPAVFSQTVRHGETPMFGSKNGAYVTGPAATWGDEYPLAEFRVTPYTPTSNRHSISFIASFSEATTDLQFCRIQTSGTLGSIHLSVGAVGQSVTLRITDPFGVGLVSSSTLLDVNTIPNGEDARVGVWPRVGLYRIVLTQSGSDVVVQAASVIRRAYATAPTPTILPAATVTGRTIKRITSVSFTSPDMSIAHVHLSSAPLVSSAWDPVIETGWEYANYGDPEDYAPAYERADTRIERLCDAAGIDYRSPGAAGSAEWLNRSPIASQAQIMREAAKADGGILCDDWTQYGMFFAPRWHLEEQPRTSPTTLDVSAGDLTVPPEYTIDDRGQSRDYTVKQAGGGSARYRASDASGSGESATLNLLGDTQLLPAAEWLAHTTSSPSQRIPSGTILLHFREDLISSWLDMTVGSVVRLANLPAEMGYGTLGAYAAAGRNYMVMGWTEKISFHTWAVAPFLQPDDVREVGKVGSMGISPSENVIASGVSSSATSFTVTVLADSAPTTPPNQTYSPAIPIVLSTGEEVWVTQTATTTTTTTYTIQRGKNGPAKAIPAGATFAVVAPSALARGDNV